jgi:glucosylceramidase
MPHQSISKPCAMLVLNCLLIALSGPGRHACAQSVTIYQTNADQSLLLAQQPSVSFGGSPTGSSTISIDPGVSYQQMDGFGASWNDSSAYVVYEKLTTAQRNAVMQSLFSTTNGIGLSFLRQPMGANDMSAQGNFSYDDMTAGETDVSLANFSIAKDMTYTIPVIQQSLSINPNLKVYMLPWSPPGWMKTSDSMIGGSFITTYYSSLANYFVKTIQAYQAQGIPIYAVSPQNEPEYTASNYPSMSVPASQEATFIGQYLGPALASNNLSTKIFAYDHNWSDTSYPETVLGDSTAGPYVAGTAWHCYGGSVTAQSVLHEAFPDKGNWQTECTGQAGGNFGADMAWTMENQIIGATRNWGRSVIDFNLATDQNYGPTNGGCDICVGFVTVNDSTSPSTVTYNETYYFWGQASKFVTPGAYRIESNSAAAGAGGIEDVAFQNPNGSIALIAFNDGSASASFNVTWAPNTSSFVYTLPAGAVATFVWTPSASSLPGAPSNLLAAASASGNQINLTWTASSTPGVTYSVYRGTASGFTPSSLNQFASGVATASYADTGATPSTTYYYVVNAANGNGFSSYSNQASATAGSTGGISESSYYTVVNQASGLCLDYGSNSNWSAPLLQDSCSSGNTAQQWWLWAPNDGLYGIGNENTNLVWTVNGGETVVDTPVIQYPYQYDSDQQWQPVLMANGYYEFVDSNSGLCLYVLGGATTGGLQLEINTCNQSSSELFALTNTSGGIPAAPSNLAAINTSGSQINLSWAASTTAGVTYSVFRSTASGFTPAPANQIASGLSATTYANTGLAASTAYYYAVEAINSNGSSPASNQASANSGSASILNTSEYYDFVNHASGSCVDDDGGVSSGTVVQQWQCSSGNTNQEWWFWQQSNGYYVIGDYNSSSSVWTVTGAGTSNNTPVEQLTWSGTNNQQWEPFPLSGGYYEFVDLNSGLCLNVPSGSGTNGLQLQIYSCNGSSSEQFQLIQQ